MNIWTLGPAGTFSSEAAKQLFPNEEPHYATNFDLLFSELEKDDNAIAVVPIENSLHGSVYEVLDYLYRADVSLWQMHDVTITHALGAQTSDGIVRIASHPQALMQCREYLSKHYAQAERFPVSSTTYALQLAAQDSSVATIAREDAILEAGLTVLAQNIEGGNNTTRFGIVAKKDPYPEAQRTRTSIVLHPHEDKAGLLHALITPFKVYDVNMSKIESRPTGLQIGDYLFFIDFVGTQDEARVKKVFEELRDVATISVLGTW